MELNELPKNIESQPSASSVRQAHLEEIADLEKRLAEKKRLAEISGIETPPEKEVFPEVVKEHILAEKEKAVPTSPSQVQTQQSQAQQDARKLQELAEHKQLEELITIAQVKSPIEAVHIAEHLKNPRLLDDLHDYLVDHYYDKLIEARKLSEL